MRGQLEQLVFDHATPVALILITWIFLIGIHSRMTLLRKSLPPGPSIWSRLRDLRSDEALSLRFIQWNKQYGSVVSVMDFTHLNKPTIVLGTPQVVIDLLDKRGSIYSGRPRNIIGGEISAKSSRGTLLPLSPKLRKFRALMTATMSIDASKNFRPLEDVETKIMMRDLLLEPSTSTTYHKHFKRSVYSVAYCTAYGHRIDELDDRHTTVHEGIEKFFIRTFLPGSYMVDHFPVLLRLPKFLQWFRREPELQAKKDGEFFLSQLDQTRSALGHGTSLFCAASRALKKQQDYGFSDIETAILTSAPFTAGVATTLGEFEAFLLAMTLFPEVMKKAQEEIDDVVGPRRMPSFNDFESLPYIQAVVKETLRWHPVIPFGIPHAADVDDVYEGMFIPKGSTVIANIYGLTRDEEVFPNPEEFKPERFLNIDDPFFKNYSMTFGFGRRICPGQHVASDQLFIMIARVLWGFNIVDPITDMNDLTIKQHGRFGPPPVLVYRLVARNEFVHSIIMEEAAVAEDEAKNWENRL